MLRAIVVMGVTLGAGAFAERVFAEEVVLRIAAPEEAAVAAPGTTLVPGTTPAGEVLEVGLVQGEDHHGFHEHAEGIEHFRVAGEATVVVDPARHRIRFHGAGGTLLRELGTDGDPLFASIGDFFVDEKGWVTFVNHQIRGLVTVDRTGGVQRVWNPDEVVHLYQVDVVEPIPGGGLVLGDETAGMVHLIGPDLELALSLEWNMNGLAVSRKGRVVLMKEEDTTYTIESYDLEGGSRRHGSVKRSTPESHWYLEGLTDQGRLVATEVTGDRSVMHRLQPDGTSLSQRAVELARALRPCRVSGDGTLHLLVRPAAGYAAEIRREPALASAAPAR